jgi:hypothetical protein
LERRRHQRGFKHHAKHIAKRHIVIKVPGLQLLRVATDGHKST